MGILESETIDLEAPTGGRVIEPSCCIGDTLSGRYRLDEEIGRGGMGIVFRGRDLELERAVAVKVIAADREDTDACERLFREARAAAALHHPHVVAVYDVGEHEGMPYFVMELIEGPSLRERRPETIEQTIELATQICDALGHAHQQGLVHRDLKPGNVLLESLAGSPSVKLVDLGLAVRERGVKISREGSISGTVAYMAPEQALGKKVDGRTDLYALGVMLYEFTTGRLPFDGDNALAVLSQHLHAPVVPPGTYRPDLPEYLDRIIIRLLAKEPDDRFSTAAEVAVALAQGPATSTAPMPAGSSAALGGLVRGRMVGRDAEIATLRRSWSQTAAGSGGMVLVSGEPGSGKTRLARELIDYARITGGAVLTGGCYELEAATPYLPFVEALRTWVHQSSDDELRGSIGDAGAELARLAPELASRIGPFPDGPDLSASEQRLRLYDGVARCLFNLAGTSGLLLFVDDLQWADKASLNLLNYLVRLVDSERVLILGCYRETELDRSHPLADSLDNWNRERAAVRIHLGRLESEATSALLSVLLGDDCLNEEFCESIHRETEGNPFFVEEVVKTLVEEGQIVCEDGEWRRREQGAHLVLPQGVKAAIGRRLDHVSEPTTTILRTAAILGKIFTFSELEAVADATEDQLLDAVDEAVAAQLLETGSGENIVFTHDKIREVLYHELNPIRRRRLHTRVAEGLESLRERGGCVSVEDLAHHFMEGGALEKGYAHAIEAAEAATRLFAYTDALRLYERARECAEALDRDDELPQIDTAMGEVYTLKGEPLASAACYEKALASSKDPGAVLALKCKIGESYVLLGDSRALTYIEEAKQAIDPAEQPAEFARVMMIEGRFHHYHGRSREAAKRLHLAMEAAERTDETVLTGWILGYLAGAYQHLIEFEESNRWARRAIALGQEKDSPGVEAIGHEFLMENAFMRGSWMESLKHAARHRELAEKGSSSDRIAWNYLGLTFARLGHGDLAGSEDAADNGLDLAERLGDERLAIFLGSWKAHAAADAGRLDEARELVGYWLERSDALGLKTGQVETRRVQAHIARLEGDFESSLEFTDQAEKLLEGTDESIHPVWMNENICHPLIATGRRREAEERIEKTLAAARRSRMPHWEGLALKVRGDYDAAIEIFSELGSRLELARTLVLRNGDGDFERANQLFTACGAPSLLSS